MTPVVIAVSTEAGEHPFTCQFSLAPGCRTVIAARAQPGAADSHRGLAGPQLAQAGVEQVDAGSARGGHRDPGSGGRDHGEAAGVHVSGGFLATQCLLRALLGLAQLARHLLVPWPPDDGEPYPEV